MKRFLLLSILIALLVLPLAACGGGGTSTTPTVPIASGPSGKVTIQGFAFSPASITVNVGDTVTWENKDSVGHTITGTGTGTGWDSGVLGSGKTYSRKFDTAGTYNYHCAIHPSMTGTVTVK